MKVIYPGSFDPVTFGHLDVIKRAAKIHEEVIVAVLINKDKKSMFSIEERVDMLKELVRDYDNVTVDSFAGLTVDYAKKVNSNVILRGIRAVADYEHEKQIAIANNTANNNIETLFMISSEKYSYLSSSIVKEFLNFGGDITSFVPALVAKKIYDKTEGGK